MKLLICYSDSGVGQGHTHVEVEGTAISYEIKDGFFKATVDSGKYGYKVDLVRHFEITSV